MSDTMSPAEIEALLAQNAADTAALPAPPSSNQKAEREAQAVPMSATADDVLAATATHRARPAARKANQRDPEPAPERDAPIVGEGAAAHTTIPALFAQYGKYVALFVGAGLISGSVVHFPLAPVRYAIIGTVGALIFATASVVSELGDRDALRLLRVAVASLALAVGIGMISGSIQHFVDIPDRAALLIPLGVVLSLAAFGMRHGLRLKRIDLALIVPWLIVAVFALGFGLGKLADAAKTQGGGSGHGHKGAVTGSGGAGDGHGDAEGRAADGHGPEGDEAHASDGKAEPGTGDGHAEDSGNGEAEDAESAHVEEEAHAEDGAHADAGAHTDAGAHAKDAEDSGHAEKKAPADDAGGVKGPENATESTLRAEDSHQERLRLVP